MPIPEGFRLENPIPQGFKVEERPLFPDLPEGFRLENEGEGRFFGRVKESLTRGREHALANVGIYESIYGGGDLPGALNLRRKLMQKESLNPIEGNWLSDIVYSSARTAGQMWETTKKAGKGAGIGAVAGGVVGVGAGLLLGGPTGEEAPLALIGAKTGAAVGGGTAATSFSFREGFGAMYADMIDQGVPHETAQQFANYGAIPYSLIEVLQLKTASPAVKEGIQAIINKAQQKVLKKGIKLYGKRLGAEVLQEMGQEVVQIAAVDIARHLSGQGVDINADYIKSQASRLFAVAKESAKAFALIPAPGVAIDVALQHSANQAAAEHQAAAADPGVVDMYSGPVPEVGQAVYESDEEVQFGEDVPEDSTLNEEYTRRENETEDGWSQRVIGKPLQTETRAGLQPTDVQQPISQFQIAVDNALAESVKKQELQTEIRKADKSRRFGEMESLAKKATGVNWRAEAKGALAGAYTALGIQPLQEVIPVESFRELDQELRVTDKISRMDAINLGDALQALFRQGKILRPFEINFARKVWGNRFADSLQDLSDAAKGKHIDITDYIAIPKAVMASGDISRTLRQNILMARKPKLWAKALRNDIELFAKDERHARMTENMALRENAELIQKSGVRINKWGPTATARTGSERFPSKFARRVPFIARSERAYTVGGNLLRMHYLAEIGKQRSGKVTTDKQWKDIGHVVNIITGEGDARRLLGLAPILNAVFFAPRLFEARVRAFTDLLNPKISWAARGILAQHVAAFVGLNGAILASLAMVPGVNVERDYRSTDFGKIRVGNTRVDFWGGYLPIARLFMRLASGEIKTKSGRTMPIEAKDTITSFLQSKLGPMPAYAIDLMKGETFIGDDVSLEADSMVEQFYQRFTPLFLQDMIDAARYGGWDAGAAGGALAFFGASVTSYPKSKFAEVLHNKNLIAQQALGEKWDNLGPDIQELLKENYPEIEYQERQAAFDRSGFGFLTRMAEQREKSVKKMYKAMPGDVQEEFDSLNLKLGGVSSKIGTDWFLNEDRRKQYENQVTFLYRSVLPKLIRSPKWDRVPPLFKAQILTKVMDELKKKVREDILATARLEDIQRIRRLR
ncbi:MAG: hypothetical protein GY938_30600 [Ketobacter sp.]|nr:hypothetical protein [Ketobacter sp.]